MALSRIGSSADLVTLLSRSSAYAATSRGRPAKSHAEQLHASVIRHYPEAPTIPLPSNVSEIFNIETSRFGPERARDIAAPVFLHGSRAAVADHGLSKAPAFGFADSVRRQQLDKQHLDSYDCFGAVSLNGSMQTNVPKPFCASGRSTYLNMPGGQWARDGKYLAEIMRKNHFTVYQMRRVKRSGGLDGLGQANSQSSSRCYSTSASGGTTTTAPNAGKASADGDEAARKPSSELDVQLSKRERLKILVRDYGRTVITFHVGISLISLGLFYTLVSSGLDLTPVIKFVSRAGAENDVTSKIMSSGSTFLVAYGIHKLFAPLRLSLTLGLTPVIVRYLRRKGILKPPKVVTK